MITSFKEFIEIESNKDYYKKLKEFVISEYEQYTCFPPYKNIFKKHILVQATEKIEEKSEIVRKTIIDFIK